MTCQTYSKMNIQIQICRKFGVRRRKGLYSPLRACIEEFAQGKRVALANLPLTWLAVGKRLDACKPRRKVEKGCSAFSYPNIRSAISVTGSFIKLLGYYRSRYSNEVQKGKNTES